MINYIWGFICGFAFGICITLVLVYSHFLNDNLRTIIEGIMQYQ